MLMDIIHTLELDALSDMDENELSYLDDIKAEPDFLDEAPRVPSNEVSFHHTPLYDRSHGRYLVPVARTT